jgi:hypothetical protein
MVASDLALRSAEMLNILVAHCQNHCHCGLKHLVPKNLSETAIKLDVSGTSV